MHESGESVFKFLIGMLGVVAVCIVSFSLWTYSYTYEKAQETRRQALNCGLVEQSVEYGPTIWVKPEDYKPYQLIPEDQLPVKEVPQ